MMHTMFKSLLLAGALQAHSVWSASCSAPTVTVMNGTYAGVYSPGYQQEFFLGMPFAQPPVDSLRFRVPVSLNTTWTGVHNATSYGLFCPGYNNDALNYEADEDCLTINVVRPVGYEGQKLPVATWIYGGGFFAVSQISSNGDRVLPKVNRS